MPATTLDRTYPHGAYWTTPLDCGHVPTTPTRFHGTGVPFTTGAARRPDGTTLCHGCADMERRAILAAAPDTFVAYVSADGRAVTTWTGGELARVTGHTYSRRAGFGHGLHCWTIVTPDGVRYYGRNSGEGLALTMRRARGQQAPCQAPDSMVIGHHSDDRVTVHRGGPAETWCGYHVSQL